MSKSKNIEMITGDPKKAIVKLALPMMLSMLLIMLYNIADSIWVAGLGPDALAAVGFITPLFMVLENNEGAKFCKKCGTPLEKKANSHEKMINSMNNEKKSDNTKIIIAALIIIAVVLAGAFIYLN